MQSGTPEPADNLRLIMETKRSSPSMTCEIVSKAAKWLKGELTGAEVHYQYAACDENDQYGFAMFDVHRMHDEIPVMLRIKIAEIRSTPFVFAQVNVAGRESGVFPFFSDISSADARLLLLHYVSDFLLSTEEP